MILLIYYGVSGIDLHGLNNVMNIIGNKDMILTKIVSLIHSSLVHIGSLHAQNNHHQFKP